jgi:hypothetical protein
MSIGSLKVFFGSGFVPGSTAVRPPLGAWTHLGAASRVLAVSAWDYSSGPGGSRP